MKLPFDTIILINLDRRKDKLDRMNTRFSDVGLDKLVNIVRLDAIDGTIIDEDWLDQNGYTPSEDYYDPYRGRGITMGEIGCAISHFSAWKKINDDPTINCALILEDDATFIDDFTTKINLLTDSIINKDWDLFYLGRKKIDQKNEVVVDGDIVEPLFSYWCLSYMINKKGAKKLIESNFEKALIPADEFVPIMNGTPGTFCETFAKNYIRNNFKALGLKEQLILPENWAFVSSETEKTNVYFKNKFFKDEMDQFILLTVATEENDRLKRFRESCEYFGVPYKILGLGQEWNGGKAENGVLTTFGGGQKVNLLRMELKSWLTHKDIVVMFTDSYDVMLLANPVDILRKFREFQSPIVFSAEKTCWPEPEKEKNYPDSITEYRFLNSGGFIGYADWILKLIETPIQDNEDDQYYYTMKYLDSLEQKIPPVTKINLKDKITPIQDDGSKLGWMSEPVFDQEVITHLTYTQPKEAKILDIGAGDGKWGKLLKKHFPEIDAIEIFEPYIERYKLNDTYKAVFKGNFLDFDFDYYDVLIMGDVFEHVSYEDVKKWLQKVKNKCKEIIVIVPFEYKQDWDGKYENKWGHHFQPDLNPEKMKKLYPELNLMKWTDSSDSVGKGEGFGLYTKTYNFHLATNIQLDSRQEIFQTLNRSIQDIQVDKLGKVINKETKSFPCVIHGNGPMEVKNFLDDLANFISGKFDEVYGFRIVNKNPKKYFRDLSMGVFFLHDLKDVREPLDRIERLSYPKNKIDLTFYYENEQYEYFFDAFSKKNTEYKSLNFIKTNGHTKSKIEFFQSNYENEKLVIVDSNYIFRNEKSLEILLDSDVKIVAPMILSENSDFVNFHLSNIGLKESYKKYDNKGIWTVDYITGIIIIDRNFLSTVIDALKSETNHVDGDWDIKLSEFMKEKGFFTYICNTHYFGTII